MLKNYLKIAWRSILNNKVYSALNILGLASGMAVAMVIGLWVQYQYSYDRSFHGYDQVYQVRRNFNSNGTTLTFNSTSLKLADALRNNIPGIENVAESDWMWAHGLKVDNRKFYLPGAQVGSDFLKMFQYPFIQGNAETALHDPYSIVLTESTAKALFGNENPMDKTIRIDNAHDVKVTGVIKDLPANSSFYFKYILPFSYFEQTQSYVKCSG
jgi:putative ABC transport system permease protein